MNKPFEMLEKAILSIAEQQGYEVIAVELKLSLAHDLGFSSLDIAQLIAMLEGVFGVDPFSNGTTLDQITTVQDMLNVYNVK